MARQNNIDSENAELLEDAYSAVYDSVELTKQLLTFSRKKSISPVYVNIQQTINKFKKLFKNTIGDRASMSINIDDNLPDILVDPVQFESSLLNIIINTRNAMPNGGTIEINAEIMAAGQFHRAIHREDNKNANECICIYIKDSGIGMSESVLERAVEPFYTTKINQGTGLGLSMVYGFLKQSGGELIIKSQPEKGTTVYMQFPIRDGKALEESKETTASLLNNKYATILVVEGRHSVRQFAVRCLDKPGVTILQADDAVTARELLKSNSVDLLFTDIVMPGDINGFELANWASSEYPELKILLTTVMTESVQKNNRFQLLAKPYSKRELTEAVSSLLEVNNISTDKLSTLTH